jgi:hypothetical protein
VTAELIVPARFNGPLKSGNGGYVAGRVAALLDGPVEVTLRRPVPLDEPMSAQVEGDSAKVLHGREMIAEGRRAPDFDLEVPGGVGIEEARVAMGGYRGLPEGPFSRCFVCGRAREDSFGVFAGALEGRRLVASTWTPPTGTADGEGRVRSEFVWAVLDCPTFFAAYMGEEELPISFLGRLTASVEAAPRAGEEHIAIAWPLGVEGRKRHAGSALLTADGRVLARGRALMIEPRG